MATGEQDEQRGRDQLNELRRRGVGGRVAALRRFRNLTVRQLAEAAQVAYPTLSRLENGKHNPTLNVLYSIADALGVSAASLLDNRAADLLQPATVDGDYLVDNIDGTPADETVHFQLDGELYDIELSRAHAADLRALLAPYIKQGRRTGGRRLTQVYDQPAEGVDTGDRRR